MGVKVGAEMVGVAGVDDVGVLELVVEGVLELMVRGRGLWVAVVDVEEGGGGVGEVEFVMIEGFDVVCPWDDGSVVLTEYDVVGKVAATKPGRVEGL